MSSSSRHLAATGGLHAAYGYSISDRRARYIVPQLFRPADRRSRALSLALPAKLDYLSNL